MPNRMTRPAMTAYAALSAVALLPTGCVAPPAYRPNSAVVAAQRQDQVPTDEQLAGLASAMAVDGSGSAMLTASPGACGSAAAPVVRIVVAEQVLFASASDQPEASAAAALVDVAGRIRQRAPGIELTVLGHTDAVGSETYNIDLSKRRAVTVLRALAARGLDPGRLSAVAIGKQQPLADNRTAAGRARNRRVEFLLSRCLAANLGVVAGLARDRALLAVDETIGRPVEVLRLDPAAGYGLAPLGTISLQLPGGDQPLPAAVKTAAPARPSTARPAAAVARPAPAPHYSPRTLTPDVQRSPLGSPVPF